MCRTGHCSCEDTKCIHTMLKLTAVECMFCLCTSCTGLHILPSWLLAVCLNSGNRTSTTRFHRCLSSRVKTCCEVPSGFPCGLHRRKWLMYVWRTLVCYCSHVVYFVQPVPSSTILAVITSLAVASISRFSLTCIISMFNMPASDTILSSEACIKFDTLCAVLLLWRRLCTITVIKQTLPLAT